MEMRVAWPANVLRVIALACALAVLLLSPWGYRYARTRHDAIAYLESGGQRIQYAPRALCPEWLPIPRWLRRVEGIQITNSHLLDFGRFEALHELAGLEFLDGENLNDDHLRSLSRFRKLQSLTASPTRYSLWCGPSAYTSYFVSDEGLRALADLPLIHLNVTSPRITDAGLVHLRRLPLQRLSLDGTSITDDGLKHLAGLPLSRLSLNETHITDRGLANLAGLPLRELSLCNRNIGDAGIPHLAGLPLERLNLAGTFVTPHGTLALRGTRTLKELHLSVPVLSQEQNDELRAAGLPYPPLVEPAASEE